jgi:predicted PolB exonuclease-like 3'-5' exonuclease
MYTSQDFKSFLFLDIECASEYRNLDELQESNPRKAELWTAKAENIRKYEDGMEGFSDEELYEKTASWYPEFGKVIVVSIGQVKFNEIDMPQMANIRSFYGDDEKELLTELMGVFSAIFTKNPNVKFVGHNIKQFDMPWLIRKALMHQISIHPNLHLQKLKPWENCILDTYEIWKFGARSSGSLDLVCMSLGVPSPKTDMKASQTSEFYWAGKLEKIKTYCEGDVKATMNVMLSLSYMTHI